MSQNLHHHPSSLTHLLDLTCLGMYMDPSNANPTKTLASLTSAWRRSTRSFLRMYVSKPTPYLYVCVFPVCSLGSVVVSVVSAATPLPAASLWVACSLRWASLSAQSNDDFHGLYWVHQRKSTISATGSLALEIMPNADLSLLRNRGLASTPNQNSRFRVRVSHQNDRMQRKWKKRESRQKTKYLD